MNMLSLLCGIRCHELYFMEVTSKDTYTFEFVTLYLSKLRSSLSHIGQCFVDFVC